MPKRLAAIVAALLLAAGCASGNAQRSPNDPWEPVNRPTYTFNDVIDRAIMKPIARGYRKVIPGFVRQGVTNFYRNALTPLTGINNLLQGKGGAATNDLGRFLLNSSFGIAGLFDPATPAGFDRNDEDFGQTLAVWGVPAGPYVVLPFRGPSTLRDALMLPLNAASDPLLYIDERSVRDKLLVLQIIDIRYRLLDAEALIKDSADRYVTIRESYLQRREYLIHDGNPPMDDDFYGEFDDPQN